ncbi:MAG TPA: hypothetical protein VIR34_02335 [Gemmatimonadaceae bacterium]|jgi:hypothetical protein
MARAIMRLQGVYYIVTGLWPVVSIYSFELITGPKTDDWLVKMVGLLAASIGLALLVAARDKRPSVEGIVLGVVSALSFTAIDVFYVLNGTLLEVYLLDALLELCIVLLLLGGAWVGRKR